MPAARGGDSKQGLVITLVFFILLSLLLGVFTYVGFAGQSDAEKKASESDAKLKTMTADRDWYKFQAYQYRAYSGQLPAKDMEALHVMRGQFKGGQLGAQAEKAEKDEVTKGLTALDQGLGWNEQQKKPNNDYARRLADLEKEWAAARESWEKAEKDKEKAQGDVKAMKDKLAEAQASFAQERQKLIDSAKKDLDRIEAQADGLRKQLEDAGKKNEELQAKIDQMQQSNAKAVATKDKDLQDLQRRLEKVEAAAPKAVVVQDFNRPKGKVVLIDKTGQMPYINLGSADNVKPQLTFAIHGVGPDGKPSKQSKGSLEVVYVVGDHLSQCRITQLVDQAREPVVRGDLLFNPAWEPTMKQHVAVAGIIDLMGDLHKERPAEVKRALQEFIRTLENQNIIVDAWLDPEDLSLKGKGLTRQTDFLVVGDTPEFEAGRAIKPEDLKSKNKDTMIGKMTELEQQAAKIGVKVVRLKDFMALTGFRPPRQLIEKPVDFHQALPAAGSPVERKPPVQAPPGPAKQ